METDTIMEHTSGVDRYATFSYIACVLFALETYHSISHICVLFRLRLLPKRDLVRVRYYFLVDMLTVTASALYTRELLWLAALQNLQHAFFFFTWNKGSYCIRVIDWSSLDWIIKPTDTKQGSVEKADNPDRLDVSLGTAFDLAVHLTYMYMIGRHMKLVPIVMSLAVVVLLGRLVLFNKKFSWANPDQVPKWVVRRVGPVNVSKRKEG